MFAARSSLAALIGLTCAQLHNKSTRRAPKRAAPTQSAIRGRRADLHASDANEAHLSVARRPTSRASVRLCVFVGRASRAADARIGRRVRKVARRNEPFAASGGALRATTARSLARPSLDENQLGSASGRLSRRPKPLHANDGWLLRRRRRPKSRFSRLDSSASLRRAAARVGRRSVLRRRLKRLVGGGGGNGAHRRRSELVCCATQRLLWPAHVCDGRKRRAM